MIAILPEPRKLSMSSTRNIFASCVIRPKMVTHRRCFAFHVTAGATIGVLTSTMSAEAVTVER